MSGRSSVTSNNRSMTQTPLRQGKPTCYSSGSPSPSVQPFSADGPATFWQRWVWSRRGNVAAAVKAITVFYRCYQLQAMERWQFYLCFFKILFFNNVFLISRCRSLPPTVLLHYISSSYIVPEFSRNNANFSSTHSKRSPSLQFHWNHNSSCDGKV